MAQYDLRLAMFAIRQHLDKFEADWKRGMVKEPADYPAEMELSDWKQQWHEWIIDL